jgi:hypothetical protein
VLASNEAAMNNPPVMPPQAKNPPNPVSGADGSDNGFSTSSTCSLMPA